MAGRRMATEPTSIEVERSAVEGRVLVFCGARDDTEAWAMARSLGCPVVSALLGDQVEQRPSPPETSLFVGPSEYLVERLSERFSSGVQVAVGTTVPSLILASCTVLVTGGTGRPRWSASARALRTDLIMSKANTGVARRLYERLLATT